MEQFLCLLLYSVLGAIVGSFVTWGVIDHRENKRRKAEPFPKPLGLYGQLSDLPVGTYTREQSVCVVVQIDDEDRRGHRYLADAWEVPQSDRFRVEEHTAKRAVTAIADPLAGGTVVDSGLTLATDDFPG